MADGKIIYEVRADDSKLDNDLDKTKSKAASVAKGAGLAIASGIAIGTAAVTKFSTQAAIDFESAFTGVIKTVDGTEQQLADLRQGILDMSKELPSSANTIAGVAEAAGQLGIKTEDVLAFTRTMIDLGETTNLSAETAATQLARLANITGMSAKDYNRLGSTIVALGNNMATTEAEISDMALGIAGAGKQVGLTEPQIMSMAAALSSVGIESAAGGTAISKVMTEIQLAVAKGGKKLEQFADVAGVSADEFSAKFKKDAAGAVLDFVNGIGRMETEGKDAILVLDNMGITEIRMRDAILRTAGAGDLLTQALSIGTEAWNANTAMTKEAELRYGTTESKLDVLKNTITGMGIELGEKLIPIILQLCEAVLPILEEILPPLADLFSEVVVPAIQQLLPPITTIISELLPPFIKLFGKITETILPPLVKILDSVLKAFTPVLNVIMRVIEKTVLPMLNTLFDLLTPILDAVFAALGPLFEALEPVFDILGELAKTVLVALNPLFDALGLIVKPLAPIFEALKIPLEALAGILKGIIGAIRWVIQNIGAALGAGEHISFGEATGLGNFAEGGKVNKTGDYLVGEEGPELVKLPAGAYIYTAEQTAKMLAPASNSNTTIINYTFNSPQALSLRDIRLEMVLAEQRQRLAGG